MTQLNSISIYIGYITMLIKEILNKKRCKVINLLHSIYYGHHSADKKKRYKLLFKNILIRHHKTKLISWIASERMRKLLSTNMSRGCQPFSWRKWRDHRYYLCLCKPQAFVVRFCQLKYYSMILKKSTTRLISTHAFFKDIFTLFFDIK